MKSFIPPANVSIQAMKGIDYIRRGSKAGTRIGRVRARQLANRRPVSLDTIKRMYSFFKRHEKNKSFKGDPLKDRGYVSWLLWGGDDGFRWVKGILKKK